MTQSRYFCWTQGHSARFLTARDSSMQMRFVSAKLGQTTVDDSSRDMSAAEIAQNIEQALRHGFREVSVTEFANEQAQIKTHFELLKLEQAPPRATIARWQDLKSEFRQYLSNDPEEYLPRNLQSFCVHDEPCRLDSSLEVAFDSNGPTAQTAQRNLIFRQGLVIDGNLDAGGFTTELPQIVIIQGDLCAKNLILTGWAEVIVTGDVKLGGILLAYDGEAGGRLKVHGNLTAQRVLGGMMYNIEVAGRTEGAVYWTDDDEATLPNATLVPCTLSGEQALEIHKHPPLVKEAYFVDSNWATGEEVQTLVFTPSQAVDLIREAKSIFGDTAGDWTWRR